MANTPGVVLGAVMGALLGSMGAVMAPKRKQLIAEIKDQNKGWAEKAKALGEDVYEEVKKHLGHDEHNVEVSQYMKGALVGMLVGASSALLLTPKTGKQVRAQIKQKYQQAVDKTGDIIETINDVKKQAPKTLKKVTKKATSLKKKIVTATKRSRRS